MWNGPVDRRLGYGCTNRDGQSIKAHRYVYEAVVGPIPQGLVLDHLCRVPGCVNPEHLEPVTQRENLMRGNTPAARKAAQMHCIHGHELTPENTYKHGRCGRACKTCANRRARERAERRQQQEAEEFMERSRDPAARLYPAGLRALWALEPGVLIIEQHPQADPRRVLQVEENRVLTEGLRTRRRTWISKKTLRRFVVWREDYA